jgi:nicotinamidase-related amidase
MEAHGIEVLTTLEERIAPRHTALLVIDMQNDYCSPGGATERNGRDISAARAMVPPLTRLIEAARAVDIPIYWAKYTLGPGSAGLSGPEILRRGHIFAGVQSTIKGTWGHDIMDDLPYRPDEDVVIEKRRPSAFVGTDLDLQLRGRGIKTLVVTGVVTTGCVESSLRDAVGLDYYVALAADCVASSRPDEQQRGLHSIESHLHYAEGVTTSDRICQVWATSTAPREAIASPA